MSDSVEIVAACGGEVITYLPHGGTAKSFKAIVERRPLQVQGGPGGSYAVSSLPVTFPIHAVDGMLAVQPRKDKLLVKKNVSDSADTEFTVQVIEREDRGLSASDAGMWTVMVQA